MISAPSKASPPGKPFTPLFSAVLGDQSCGVAADVSEALNGDSNVFECQAAFAQGLGQHVHDSTAGGRLAAFRTEQVQRLACHDARRKSFVLGILVHDPPHDLGIGVDVGRRDVRVRTNDFLHLLDEADRDLEQVLLGQSMGIAIDAALGATVRHVHDRGFPGHQVGQRRGMLFIHRRMKTQATLHRAAGVVVLYTVTFIGLQFAVFAFDGDTHLDGAVRRQQNRPDLVGQSNHVGGFMKIEMAFS